MDEVHHWPEWSLVRQLARGTRRKDGHDSRIPLQAQFRLTGNSKASLFARHSVKSFRKTHVSAMDADPDPAA